MPLIRVRATLSSGAATGGGLANFFFITSAVTTPLCQAAVDKVRDFWAALTTGYDAQLSWSVLGVVDTIDAATGAITAQTGVTARNGAATGAATTMPLANQVVCRWNTASFVAGRQLIGHTFIPRPLVTTGSSTAPGGTTLAQAQNAVAALVAPAADPSFSVYSKTHQVAHNVQTGAVSTKWGILRSRRD